jgi:hypothetical protein
MIAPVLLACKTARRATSETIETYSPFCPAIEKDQMYRCRRAFTAARGRDNFCSLLLNVAGIDISYFNEKRLRRLAE